MRFFALLFLAATSLLAQNPGPETAPAPVTAPATATATSLGAARNNVGETILSPRIRNITRLHNSMPHQLIGIGIVTGLAKTGSSDRGTRQALLNIVRQNGLNLTIADVVGGTCTLVTLTCTLPPFAKEGQQLDVKCEVMTDASSLRGGELLRAELKGVDGQTYVVAQGAVTVTGYVAKGATVDLAKNPGPTGWCLNAGLVVREQESSFYSESGSLELQLLNPSPYNAASIASGIAAALDGTNARVMPVDTSLVRIELPEDERTDQNAIRILNLVGNTRVAVENPAKIMIDQVSGTVLAGEGVLISPCVVGLSELTIAIVNEEDVVQPNPLAQGTTERVGRSRVEVQQDNTELQQVGGSGATVSELLANLKTLGLTPAQLVSVFQALDQGGFLHAQLEVR
ncbi:MAG: flagellar basal body P-ring protein FlgI [Planctomycetes bacterium]|nr:flagellar basal body P-ring protein FlgI [Planctomycetota bacterium]MCC7061331.1 flagellar basal body P-ring protein FlgI [Planctomycetota bacterium]